MTVDELRAKYGVAYKIIERERKWRAHVFAPGTSRHDEKQREMDRLLEVMTDLKDELKQRLEREEYRQPRLLDAPRRESYG